MLLLPLRTQIGTDAAINSARIIKHPTKKKFLVLSECSLWIRISIHTPRTPPLNYRHVLPPNDNIKFPLKTHFCFIDRRTIESHLHQIKIHKKNPKRILTAARSVTCMFADALCIFKRARTAFEPHRVNVTKIEYSCSRRF
jgi:hypothetical protein